MSGFQRDSRRNPMLPSGANGLPASKRPRVGLSSTDDDDPFEDDDDITGEEWEFVASQAESKLTQEQVLQHDVPNGHKSNCFAKGPSFKAPAPKKCNVKVTRSGTSSNGLMKELQEKLALYENKVKELEQLYKRKDGETMVLRDRLSTTEKNLSQEKMRILEMQNSHEQVEAEREKKMQKEIEKFKDQVQFKQAEIMESQNLIRNLEAKNKLLEQQKLGSRISSASTSPFGGGKGVDSEALGSQDFNHSVAKRIKLVKPESPRVSSTLLLQPPEFNDDPLGRKKGLKQKVSSPCKRGSGNAEKACRFSRKFSLTSKYISNDLSDRLSGQELLRVNSQSKDMSVKNKQQSTPFLNLIDISAAPECIGAMNCLHSLIACHEESKVFGNLCGKMKDVSHSDESTSALLSLVETSITSYVNLQDVLLNRRMLSQETSSFHTARSELNSEGMAPAGKRLLPDIPKTCQTAYYALEVLDTLITYSRKAECRILNDVLISNALKICNLERWHPSLEMSEDITNIALCVIRKLVASSNPTQLFRFLDFVKADILQPLLAHRNIRLKYNAITVLISLAYHAPFVATLVKEDNSGSPSLLCHICDLVCMQQPREVSDDYWLLFTKKIVTLLSVLTARHESVLIEHSCFCEVYHAADILLYNQLVLWKNKLKSNLTRLQLIKSTLCLLHSCANIYSDGIPNSRRDHRHQLTLTNLERFLSKDGDDSSFWSQELDRIVKSEVKAIYEESESS